MEYKKVERYPGIYTKEKNGITCYYARFRFRNKLYPFINLTYIYRVRKPSEAFLKLQAIKDELRNGINSFSKKHDTTEPTIAKLWTKFIEKKKSESAISTIKEYTKFYNKWLKKPLENKKVSEITEYDLESILNKTDPKTNKGLKFGSGGYKGNLKKILSPFFKDALKKRYIKENILEDSSFKFKRIKKKNKISDRTNIRHLEIAKMLYKTIHIYKVGSSKRSLETQAFLYLFLMTGHRYGELLKLTKENLILDEKKVKATSEITKTKITIYYPIPEECMDYFNTIQDGKLFKNIKYGAVYGIFQRLKNQSNIDFKLTAHEIRNLLLNSMIKLGIDSAIANRACLDHGIDEVLEAYMDLDYEEKLKAYNKYWGALRN
ncbi:tyrosine-type recombinase/integrase [Aliarcobacter butzleri]|uniref:tyrosine-type recombinase/integrase n=1 Tax=Aliarcobacter TaxID=2321111 RepID=UPI002B23FCED|nr:tyrosine-type recombinase/integrase [Aliarcobacter butzleri]